MNLDAQEDEERLTSVSSTGLDENFTPPQHNPPSHPEHLTDVSSGGLSQVQPTTSLGLSNVLTASPIIASTPVPQMPRAARRRAGRKGEDVVRSARPKRAEFRTTRIVPLMAATRPHSSSKAASHTGYTSSSSSPSLRIITPPPTVVDLTQSKPGPRPTDHVLELTDTSSSEPEVLN